MKTKIRLAAAALYAAAGCLAPGRTQSEPSQPELLASWMSGYYTSAAQALDDPARFFEIHLTTVPIWVERLDGPWLYVEQAAAWSLEQPYRQRVYQLVETADGVRSDVYELPGDPLLFAGAWESPEDFASLEPEELLLRGGCSIELRRTAEGFEGSTLGEGCASSLRGASYATSEVFVAEGVLASWDRGFDAQGRQVWGATAGPYLFLRE